MATPKVRAGIKYALLQVPGLALVILGLAVVKQWVDLPGWLMWGFPAFWVVKDILLFPFVWKAYQEPADSGGMVGRQGVAVESLRPSGYIRIRNELWKAELKNRNLSVDRGETIRVVDSQGLTLIVVPETENAVQRRAG